MPFSTKFLFSIIFIWSNILTFRSCFAWNIFFKLKSFKKFHMCSIILDLWQKIPNFKLTTFSTPKEKKLSWNFFPTSVDTDYRGRKEKRKVIFKRDKSEKDWKEEIFHNVFEINSIWLSFIIQIAIYDPFGELNFSLVQLSLTGKTVYYVDNPSRAVFCRWLFASIEMFSFSFLFWQKW